MKALRTIGMVWVVLAGAASSAPAKAVESPGSIEAVTVYRGEALVTRAIPLDAPAGAVDLTVSGLPEQIRANSLYASGEGVQIRAVQFRTRAVPREPREDLRKIDTALQEVQRSIRENETKQKSLTQKEAYLVSLEKFTAEKTVDEKSRGKLDMAQLKQATEYVFEQRDKLAGEKLKLAEQQRELKEKLALLERERKQIAAKSAPTVREAVLFVDKQAAGKATVRLSYLVGNASWSPIYNLRCGADGKQVTLEYNSLVQQMSGEDWTGVQVTLSTASPTMVSEAPVLTPLWVALRPKSKQQPPQTAELLLGGQKSAGDNLRKALQQRGKEGQAALDQDWNVNTWANRLQMMDIQAGQELLMAGKEQARAEQGLSVSYSLPGRISIPSRSDQQMIQIASLKLQGRSYHLAVPLLTASVYQHAEIVNTSDLALLTGPVSAYLGGQFMGTGRVPMVAKGQTFTVGFGVDSQLRGARELADKIDKVQGGNREITFRYRLLIENYKDKPVRVRVVDRLPDPRGGDIRITLGPLGEPLSKDPIYLRTIRKMGILQWEIDVPPKAAREKAKTVEYEFKMEFDRNLAIGEPGAAELEKGKARFRRSHEAMLAH